MKSSSSNWRKILPIHPAAQLLPPMTARELRELSEDIRARGLLQPIVIFQESVEGGGVCYSLLDGVNRLDAMELVGIKFSVAHDGSTGWTFSIGSNCHRARDVPASVVVVDGIDDPFAFVLSANLHRRHLTAEQKRELVAKLLRVTPEKSNRQIAEAVKVDHKTVASVRAEKQATGEIPQLTTTLGKDGKKRAHKPRPAGDRAAERSQRLEHASDQETHAPHQIDADYLITQFTTQVRSNGLEIAREIDAAFCPTLIERLHEVVDEIELEVERWPKEAHRLDEELPDIPAFLRQRAS